MEELYKKIDNVFLTHVLLYEKAMKACQAMGYNGFKRMYRILSKKYWCDHIGLANELYDKYRMVLDTNMTDFNYKPSSLKEHLTYMDSKLKSDIAELGRYNKAYFEETGVECGAIKDAVSCMVHDFEKTGRWIKRFDETQWRWTRLTLCG